MTLEDLQPLASKDTLTEAERDAIMGTPEAHATWDPQARVLTWFPARPPGPFRYVEQPVRPSKPWERRRQARSTWYRNTSPATLLRDIASVRQQVNAALDKLERRVRGMVDGEKDVI